MSESACGGATDSCSSSTKKYRDAEWLQEQYHSKGKTSYEMADDAGCSASTIRSWMEKHNIERRESGKPVSDERLLDESWFREMYEERGHSTSDIAEICDVPRPTVQDWKRKHGIESVTEYKSRGDGSDNPNGKEYVDTECKWCEQPLSLPIRQVERAENNFCSYQCNASYRSVHIRGEDHPLYINGSHEDYGPNWRQRRREARSRDNYQCQSCGVEESELERQLHVHHIIPRRKFDDIEVANELDNLVSLCGSCHHRYEGIPLRPVVIE